MIGIDPHKGSHTAVAVTAAGEPLGKVRVRACPAQAEKLIAWAAAWPERIWTVEGAPGLGRLLAQQLVTAGERVLDVQPKLAARVRLHESCIRTNLKHRVGDPALANTASRPLLYVTQYGRCCQRPKPADGRAQGPAGTRGSCCPSSMASR
jgi:Transposase